MTGPYPKQKEERDFIELGEEQAKVFAYWYFLLRQPEQAAQKAGVQDGVLLLGDRRVRRELRRLRREFAKQGAGELAKLGLCRLLFAQAERDGEGNPVFDGFSAERFGTGKGMEYKAWDKLKACELLLRLAERENQGGSEFGEVLQALQEGARQLDDWKEADEP